MDTRKLLNKASDAGLNSLHDLRLLFQLGQDPDGGLYHQELLDTLPTAGVHAALQRLMERGLVKRYEKPRSTGTTGVLRAYYKLTPKGWRWVR